MKYLIVGRSATGKDALARCLAEEYGMTQVKTFTTRKRRSKDENTHFFIAPELMDAVTDKIAETNIDGNLYFASVSQIEECDICIVDPSGCRDILNRMPNTEFTLIYMMSDRNRAKEKAIGRADEKKEEKKIWKRRIEAEDQAFSDFEEEIRGKKALSKNCRIEQYYNDFKLSSLKKFAEHLSHL